MSICKKIPKPDVMIRYVRLAENLASTNPTGKVPSVTWLRDNDHAGLYQYMRAHPRLFKHLSQERRGPRTYVEKIKQRQVALAEKLAGRNKNVLQSGSWLIEHSYGDLVSYMRRHPEFFEHITQLQDKSTPEEHVKTAERLAKENGGTFPRSWTVIGERGWALYAYMRRKPELFSHIPRETNRKRAV